MSEKKILFIGPVPILFDNYFDSAEEANEWLWFESDDHDLEAAAYMYPDRFYEWSRWRDADAQNPVR